MERSWLSEARPHLRRAALYAVLATCGLVIASYGRAVGPATPTERVLAYAGAALLAVVGVAGVRAAARAARAVTTARAGDTRGATLGLVVTVVGYAVVGLTVLSLLGADLSGLLLGGAITGVVVGIAAQQTLGNFFAGLVLLATRPFEVGERVVLRSGALGGEFEGVVTDMGLVHVEMTTDHGPVKLPNAGVLAAAIGPGARQPREEQRAPAPAGEEPGPRAGGPPGGAPEGRP